MKILNLNSLKWTLAGCVLVGSVLQANESRAEIVLYEKDGLTFGTSGQVNAYLSWALADRFPTPNSTTPVAPAVGVPRKFVGPQNSLNGVAGFGDGSATAPADGDIVTARVRGGYASTLLRFNVKQQIAEDHSVSARIGFWMPVHGAEQTKNHEIPASVREQYAKLTGPWGSILGGRDVALYGRGQMTMNYTLVHDEGVGHPCNIDSNTAAACGSSGVGNLFGNRNAQITYTTPKFSDIDVSIGLFDPIKLPVVVPPTVAPAPPAVPSPANYDRTPMPRIEMEANLEKQLNETTKLVLFLNGMAQSLAQSTSNKTAMPLGIGGGGRVHLGALGLGAVFHAGKGIGTATSFGPESVDANGELRSVLGVQVAGNYRVMDTELALSFGTVGATESDFDKSSDAVSLVESNSSVAAKVAQHVGPFVFSADYMRVMTKWYKGEEQNGNLIHIGTKYGW